MLGNLGGSSRVWYDILFDQVSRRNNGLAVEYVGIVWEFISSSLGSELVG